MNSRPSLSELISETQNLLEEKARDKVITEKENEHLVVRGEEIRKEIADHCAKLDEDYDKKKKDVDAMKESSEKRIEMIESELGKSETYKQESESYNLFIKKFEPELKMIEESVGQYESSIHESIRDFDRPLKKIEKVH
jgi:hypothetical protein